MVLRLGTDKGAIFYLWIVSACLSSVDSSFEWLISERALLFTDSSRSERLSTNIINGNINSAAATLVDAVSDNDGSSIVRGLNRARQRPGSDFSVVQTLVRAYGMGLDPTSLEDTVHRVSSDDNDEAEETENVIHRVSTVIHETDSEMFDSPSPYPDKKESKRESAVKFVDPLETRSNSFAMEDPIPQCRGRKEIECCLKNSPSTIGCQCENYEILDPDLSFSAVSDGPNQALSCRFTFESRDPLILRDTRREDHWLCACT